ELRHRPRGPAAVVPGRRPADGAEYRGDPARPRRDPQASFRGISGARPLTLPSPPVGERGTAPSGELGDDPSRPLAAGHALDVVEAVAEPRRPVLPGGPGRVRRERDV